MFIYAVIFIVAIAIIACINSGYEKEIKEWAAKNNEKVETIERCFFHIGPYYISKNCYIYRVETNTGVYWFRYGLFYDDIEKETLHGYIKIR